MATRFELVAEDDQVHFQLRGADGSVLVKDVGGSSGRIGAQNGILHLRRAVQDPTHMVEHRGKDGSRFLVIKEANGDVIARSAHVDSPERLAALAREIPIAAANAPIIDLTRQRRSATG